MAKQMSYTVSSGLTAANSYWICSSIHIDMLNSEAIIAFTAWVDSASLMAGKAPIDQKQFVVKNIPATAQITDGTGAVIVPGVAADPQFDNYFSPNALNTAGSQVSFQGYKYATEKTTLFATAIDVA